MVWSLICSRQSTGFRHWNFRVLSLQPCWSSRTIRNFCIRGEIYSHFNNNCPISRALIGPLLSSISVQTNKIWKLGLARPALCKWATCTRHTCLSKTLLISGTYPVSGFFYCKNNFSFLCVCPLTEDKFRHNIVKVCCVATRLRLVVLQPLWQCYDISFHQ